MFSAKQFQVMCASARALHLNIPDTGRLLWSYYASRLPGARAQDAASTQIAIRDAAGREQRVCIRNNGFDWLNLDEVWVQHIYGLDLKGVRRILDLGANIGVATLWFAWTYPESQICSVEPIPDNLALLHRNVQLTQGAVRVVAAAAGPADGKTRFNISDDPRQHSASLAVMWSEQTLEVDVVSGPSLMALMGWDEIDLLKIDIEGGERELLGGQPSWLTKVRCIIGEGHVGAGYSMDVCRRDLEPMGFRVEQLQKSEGSMIFLATAASAGANR